MSFPNELVTKLLEEIQCFLLRMAAVFVTRKEQLIVSINNYDLALSIITERIRGNFKEMDTFRSLLDAKILEYVEILPSYFGGIMQHVREGELLIEQDRLEDLKKQEGKQKILSLINEVVRAAAVEALANLYIAMKRCYTEEIPTSVPVDQLIPEICVVVKDNENVEVVYAVLEGYQKILQDVPQIVVEGK